LRQQAPLKQSRQKMSFESDSSQAPYTKHIHVLRE